MRLRTAVKRGNISFSPRLFINFMVGFSRMSLLEYSKSGFKITFCHTITYPSDKLLGSCSLCKFNESTLDS